MAEYDDGAYYEVQLNNKQLVFFFMAALAIAVVVFLCGVMVGRGVRDATLAASAGDISLTPLRAPSDSGTSAARPTAAPRLDYAERLERSEVDGKLESSSPETAVASAAKSSAPAPSPPPVPRAAASTPKPVAAAPVKSSSTLGADSGPFTIQVVALKTEDAAQKLLSRLRGKSYRAYLEAGGEAGLHRVRVGRFQTRAEAETVAKKLRDEEQFRPYITQ